MARKKRSDDILAIRGDLAGSGVAEGLTGQGLDDAEAEMAVAPDADGAVDARGDGDEGILGDEALEDAVGVIEDLGEAERTVGVVGLGVPDAHGAVGGAGDDVLP